VPTVPTNKIFEITNEEDETLTLTANVAMGISVLADTLSRKLSARNKQYLAAQLIKDDPAIVASMLKILGTNAFKEIMKHYYGP